MITRVDCYGEKDPNGDWIRYKDYVEEIAPLEEEIQKLKDRLRVGEFNILVSFSTSKKAWMLLMPHHSHTTDPESLARIAFETKIKMVIPGRDTTWPTMEEALDAAIESLEKAGMWDQLV